MFFLRETLENIICFPKNIPKQYHKPTNFHYRLTKNNTINLQTYQNNIRLRTIGFVPHQTLGNQNQAVIIIWLAPTAGTKTGK